jgi:hypothetical protein
MVSRVQRNRSRLPEPTRFRPNLNIESLARYVEDLVKTLRIRLESIESEMDYQDERTRLVESDVDIDIDTSTPIVIATAAIDVNLPTAADAFDDQAVIAVRATGGAVSVVAADGDLIEGGGNLIIPNNQARTLVSDGDNWWIIASYS